MSSDYLTIIGIDDSSDDRSGYFSRSGASLIAGRVGLKQLESNLLSLIEGLEVATSNLPKRDSGFVLDSVSVVAEVTASGSLSLLGSGVQTSGKGGITLTLKRKGHLETREE